MSFCPGIVALNDAGERGGNVSFAIVTEDVFHGLGEADVTAAGIRGEDQNFRFWGFQYGCSMLGSFIVNFHKIVFSNSWARATARVYTCPPDSLPLLYYGTAR